VVDCTVEPPAVLREGAVPKTEALRRLDAAVRSG
jgi:tRNA A37 threonylcarbamoyladenosine synthetase subunit TsaC/SUA5/YrdC